MCIFIPFQASWTTPAALGCANFAGAWSTNDNHEYKQAPKRDPYARKHLEASFGSPHPLLRLLSGRLRLLYWSQFRLSVATWLEPILAVLRFASQLDMIYENGESGFGAALPLIILDLTRVPDASVLHCEVIIYRHFRDHRIWSCARYLQSPIPTQKSPKKSCQVIICI